MLGERVGQVCQRGARERDRLARVVDEVHLIDAVSRDDHNGAIVVLEAGAGSTSQARVRCLRDDDEVVVDGYLQRPPHLDQRAGAHHGEDWSSAESIAFAEWHRGTLRGQYMFVADDSLERIDRFVRSRGGLSWLRHL